MHLQVKTGTGGTGFPAGDEINESTSYKRGTFSDLLAELANANPPINVRGANGHRIEFGGSFSFFAGAPGDDDEGRISAETERAFEVLKDKGWDVHLVEVSNRLLDDTPGALAAFVEEITGQGLWVEDILVGSPTSAGQVPVQLFTSRTG
jgi:hypothetical protein